MLTKNTIGNILCLKRKNYLTGSVWFQKKMAVQLETNMKLFKYLL